MDLVPWYDLCVTERDRDKERKTDGKRWDNKRERERERIQKRRKKRKQESGRERVRQTRHAEKKMRGNLTKQRLYTKRLKKWRYLQENQALSLWTAWLCSYTRLSSGSKSPYFPPNPRMKQEKSIDVLLYPYHLSYGAIWNRFRSALAVFLSFPIP